MINHLKNPDKSKTQLSQRIRLYGSWLSKLEDFIPKYKEACKKEYKSSRDSIRRVLTLKERVTLGLDLLEIQVKSKMSVEQTIFKSSENIKRLLFFGLSKSSSQVNLLSKEDLMKALTYYHDTGISNESIFPESLYKMNAILLQIEHELEHCILKTGKLLIICLQP
jgi:hypothetical protein